MKKKKLNSNNPKYKTDKKDEKEYERKFVRTVKGCKVYLLYEINYNNKN